MKAKLTTILGAAALVISLGTAGCSSPEETAGNDGKPAPKQGDTGPTGAKINASGVKGHLPRMGVAGGPKPSNP